MKATQEELQQFILSGDVEGAAHAIETENNIAVLAATDVEGNTALHNVYLYAIDLLSNTLTEPSVSRDTDRPTPRFVERYRSSLFSDDNKRLRLADISECADYV